MTIIDPTSTTRPITSAADIIESYAGTDTNPHLGGTPKIGLEIEQTLFNQSTGNPISIADNTAIITQARDKNITVNQEPSAALLELTSPAYLPKDLPILLKELCHEAHGLHDIAANMDIGISPFGQLPAATLDQHEVVNLERYQTFFAPPRADMVDTFRFFASCLNIQASVSYRNADHLLDIIRMATALEPILFLSTDSSSGFTRSRERKNIHNLSQKDRLSPNAGIPDFYYTAKTGEEFITDHINFTFTNPHIFACFDDDNKLTRLPAGQWTSYNQLEALKLGPQNQANYLQSQSESWRRACNIATILDDNGTLIGHRAELAAFQTGLMHQRSTAAILTNFIAFDEQFYTAAAALLKQFGIDLQDLQSCKPALESNFKNACYHNNQFHEVPFGNATLKDFAIPFAAIIEAAADRNALAPYAAPILHILRSGRPDWLVYREKFQTLEDTLHYMHNFNTHVKTVPDLLSPWSCADWALPKLGMK